jgi:hypothetical protein
MDVLFNTYTSSGSRRSGCVNEEGQPKTEPLYRLSPSNGSRRKRDGGCAQVQPEGVWLLRAGKHVGRRARGYDEARALTATEGCGPARVLFLHSRSGVHVILVVGTAFVGRSDHSTQLVDTLMARCMIQAGAGGIGRGPADFGQWAAWAGHRRDGVGGNRLTSLTYSPLFARTYGASGVRCA